MSDWTLPALKEHLEALIAEKVACADERTANVRAALDAHVVAQQRMDDDLHRDISAVHAVTPTLLPRSDYEVRHAQLADRISALASRVDRSEGTQTGQSDVVARMIAVVAALAAVGVVLVTLLR